MLLVWLIVSFFYLIYFLVFLFSFQFLFCGNRIIILNLIGFFCFYMNCVRAYTKIFFNIQIYFCCFLFFFAVSL